MRRVFGFMALLGVLVSCTQATAEQRMVRSAGPIQQSGTVVGGGVYYGDPAPCRGHCRGRHHRHAGIAVEGMDPHFNCGCNGSYNYPVPPLYTYHWPGMYKQPLMTDYHYPYRFPPLKPFTDVELPTAPVVPLEEEIEGELNGDVSTPLTPVRAASLRGSRVFR